MFKKVLAILLVVTLFMSFFSFGVYALEKGDKGEKVKKLQKRLNKLGYYRITKLTGVYGDEEVEAVKAFQSNNGLQPTGIADDETLELIFDKKKAKRAQKKKADQEGKTVTESTSAVTTNNDANIALYGAGLKYTTQYVMDIAPSILGISDKQCRITEVYCLDMGNDTYQFTARVSRGGPGGYGIGLALKCKLKSDGSYDITQNNHLYLYSGSDTIPGELIVGNANEASKAQSWAELGKALKEIDVNGDGELSIDEIFEMN